MTSRTSATKYRDGQSLSALADANLVSYSTMRRKVLAQGGTLRRSGPQTTVKSHETPVEPAYWKKDKHHLESQLRLFRNELDEHRGAYAKLRTQSEAEITKLKEDRRLLEVRLQDSHAQLEDALEEVRALRLEVSVRKKLSFKSSEER